MMKDIPLVGLGLDDLCAIHIDGDRYRVLSADGKAGMHRIEWIDGRCDESFLPGFTDLKALDPLVARRSLG
jgi:hypothetical protein